MQITPALLGELVDALEVMPDADVAAARVRIVAGMRAVRAGAGRDIATITKAREIERADPAFVVFMHYAWKTSTEELERIFAL